MKTPAFLIFLVLLLHVPLLVRAVVVIQPAGAGGGGGGGTSPGLTSLVAWYDFADATDADGGTYNLTNNGTAAFTAGPPSYVTTTTGTPGAYLSSTALDDSLLTPDGDWSFVFRVRGIAGVASGDVIFTSNGNRAYLEYNTTGGTGLRGTVATTTVKNSAVVPSQDTWYVVVITRSTATNIVSISVNGSTLADSSTTTDGSGAGTSLFGAASTSNSNPFDIDYAGFYNKVLTQDNCTWLYNAGATRTYSEL